MTKERDNKQREMEESLREKEKIKNSEEGERRKGQRKTKERVKDRGGSTKDNGRELKSCLGRVFIFKLVRFVSIAVEAHSISPAASIVENSAQVLSF